MGSVISGDAASSAGTDSARGPATSTASGPDTAAGCDTRPARVSPPQPRRRLWLSAALALLLVVVVSAGWVNSDLSGDARRPRSRANRTAIRSRTRAAPPSAQVNPADAPATKDHFCQVFDVSVRGQQGKGGFRVEGNPNVPLLLRALNSASAVQNALGPAVPPDVAAAARKYISSTLDVTTAAMGNTSTPEVNRLTDVDA